jgi:hypothetical protein
MRPPSAAFALFDPYASIAQLVVWSNVEVGQEKLEHGMRPVLETHAMRKHGAATCLAVVPLTWKQHASPILYLLGEGIVNGQECIIAVSPGS